jgi:phage terminase small subunit
VSQQQKTLQKIIKKQLRRLTPKQHKFVLLIVTKGERSSPADLAIEAGYSEKSAPQMAANLQNPKIFPQVVAEIQRMRDEYNEKFKVTYSRHIKRLDVLSHKAEDAGNWNAAVQAEKSRGQAAGLYIDRKEILTGSIDQMSKEEVESKLKEIEKQFSINTDIIEVKEQDLKIDNKDK